MLDQLKSVLNIFFHLASAAHEGDVIIWHRYRTRSKFPRTVTHGRARQHRQGIDTDPYVV